MTIMIDDRQKETVHPTNKEDIQRLIHQAEELLRLLSLKNLVDTSVWSLALRRKTIPANRFVDELNELIKERRVQMIGPIRQEILSGIRALQFATKLNCPTLSALIDSFRTPIIIFPL